MPSKRGWAERMGRVGSLSVVVLLAAALQSDVAVATSHSHECNQTIHIEDLESGEDTNSLTFTLPNIGRSFRGNPFYCWFRFEGTHAQYVLVDVTELQVGDFNVESGTCEGGYLRISDTDACSTDPAWFPPTEICGTFDEGRVRVKRYTRSPLAFVEYRVDKAKTTKNYQFDVEFLDIAANPDDLPFGHLQRKKGRVENTKCDWLIDVDECIGHCHVTTPGYPGIYPPNTRCRYLFMSFTDARVQLQMGGLMFTGKFDMKQNDNCSTAEDYVEVFDGMSTYSPSFGRFCGNEGDYLVSSGSGMLLIFQSGIGGPPWDYSGFDLRLTDRWKTEHDGGTLTPGTLCDWEFESRGLEDGEGSAHTPDHILENTTTCLYTFNALPNERLQLELVVRKLDPDCGEYLEVFDGDRSVMKICAKDIAFRGRRSFSHNCTSSTASIRYTKVAPQVSNVNPSWLYFYFEKVPGRSARKPVNGINVEQGSGGKTSKVTDGSETRAMTSAVLVFLATSLVMSLIYP